MNRYQIRYLQCAFFSYLRSLSSRALRIYTCVTSVIHTRNSWCYPWDAVQATLREKATSLATKVTCVRACTTPSLMDNSVVVSDMPPQVDNVDFAVGLASLALVAEPHKLFFYSLPPMVDYFIDSVIVNERWAYSQSPWADCPA